MKLECYETALAIQEGRYDDLGRAMAEHFGVPELEVIAVTRSPGIIKSDSFVARYWVTIVVGGRGYHWKSNVGFIAGGNYALGDVAFYIVTGSSVQHGLTFV